MNKLPIQMKINNKRIFAFVSLCFILYSLFFIPAVSAAGISFSPSVEYVNLTNEKEASREFVLRNSTNSIFEADLSVQNFRLEEGSKTPIYTDAGGGVLTSSLTQYANISPQSVRLSPGEQAKVTLKISPPEDFRFAQSDGNLTLFATEKNGNVIPGGTSIRTQIGALILVSRYESVTATQEIISIWQKMGIFRYILMLLIVFIAMDVAYRLYKKSNAKKLSDKYSILDESDL